MAAEDSSVSSLVPNSFNKNNKPITTTTTTAISAAALRHNRLCQQQNQQNPPPAKINLPAREPSQRSSMAASDEHAALLKAFTGFGVDEKLFITTLGKWNHDKRKSFRKGAREFFSEDERQFERWDDKHILQLRQEFLRLKDAVVVWTMHPWERDARLLKEALVKPQYDVIIEVACSRSAEELLGARRAYHSLFDHSVEEDVASYITGPQRKVLLALVSSYRYEGPRVNEETAKSEAKLLSAAVKKKNPIEDEEVVRIVSLRSKLHLKQLYKYYKELSGKNLDEDLDGVLKTTVQCLVTPPSYYSKILETSLKLDVDEAAKDSVTRVIVTRADVDMKLIKEEYQQKCGITLEKKIEEVANGSYKDFLLTLIARGD